MRKRWMFPVALAMAGLGWTANTVFSQDMGGGEKPAAGGEADAAAKEMEMMQAWMKYMTPGEGHKRLQAQVGKWTVKGSMWMSPGSAPTPMDGEATMSLVLGGRYLRHEYKGNMTMENGMVMPFEGLGYTGYDNALKLYQSTWMDSFGTGIFSSEGAAAADGKSFSVTGRMTDPMGGRTPMREVMTDRSADEMVMEMYMKPEGGEEFRMMELIYTRKK